MQIDTKLHKNELISGVCIKHFHDLFSAFYSLLKECKLHMHLGPNQFSIKFLKSSPYFLGVNSISECF